MGIFTSKNARELAKQLTSSSSSEDIMFPWRPLRESASLKGHLTPETILKPQHVDRGRAVSNVARHERDLGLSSSLPHQDRAGIQHLDYCQAAASATGPQSGGCLPQRSPQQAYGDSELMKIGAPPPSCGRMALGDPRSRPVMAESHAISGHYPREQRHTSHKTHQTPSPCAQESSYSNGVHSSMDRHSSTANHLHPQFPLHQPNTACKRPLPYESIAPNDVTIVDRELRRSGVAQELKLDVARIATCQHAPLPPSGPSTSSVGGGVGRDWHAQFGALALSRTSGSSPMRRVGSVSAKPEVSPEYSPPLDLSLKQLPGKRRIPDATNDDQPLDLSVKRQKKDVDESDDDVILVGVHSPPNSAGYLNAGNRAGQSAGYDKRHIPMAHLGIPPQTRPVTSDAFLQSIQNRYPSPRTIPIVTSAGCHMTVNSSKHVIDSPFHVTRPAVSLPYSPQSRQMSPGVSQSRHPVSQSGLPSPIQHGHNTSPMSVHRCSVSPLTAHHPRHLTSVPSHLRHAGPMPNQPALPDHNGVNRDARHGVPLVWGFEYQKSKSDPKHISSHCTAQVKHADTSPYSRNPLPAKRGQDLGLESRVGPPETYQGPSGQERHIQRIDKHQELLGYANKQQGGQIWIPASNGIGFAPGPHPGHPVQTSPCPGVQHLPNRTTRSDVLPSKEPKSDRCPSSSSVKDRAGYRDPTSGSVRYAAHQQHMAYTATVASAPPEAAKHTSSSAGSVGSKNQTQQIGNSLTVTDIPKYMVTVQGNKLYQQPKTDKPYHELLSGAVPSTVEEPVRLTQQHPYPMMSVPIIKEENSLPRKSSIQVYDGHKPGKAIGDGAAVTAAAKSDPHHPDANNATALRADDGIGGQAPSGGGTNMVSKTESMFVGAAHKMIPVANVHPIRKPTAGAAPKTEGSTDQDETLLEEAKKDESKDDGKKVENVVGELPSKIQITPNPVFNSHQEEFVRFLSRSTAGSPNLGAASRFSKKQLKMLAKSGIEQMRDKLYKDRDNVVHAAAVNDVDDDDSSGQSLSPELRNKLAKLREMEQVPSDLALHFSTPKGRHKLLAKRNSHLLDGLRSELRVNKLDGVHTYSSATDGSLGQEEDSRSLEPLDDGTRKKTKAKRRKQLREALDQPGGRKAGEKVPCKKRRKKHVDVVEDGDTFEEVDLSSPGADENRVRKAGGKKSRRFVNRERRVESDVVRRTYRRKNQRVITRHKALRKSRRVALYDKNAAYEAELRKEEERRLLRRVKREERCHVLPQPCQTGDAQCQLKVITTGEQEDEPGPFGETDYVTDMEAGDNAGEMEVRAMRSAKQIGLKRMRKLSLRKRVGCRKGKRLRDPRFSAEAVVELHPLSMRSKVKAKRLPMKKVMRRRLRKEPRPCNNRSMTDNTDKKRLFVCRETGETTLHKAARKGYVEAALQCLDSDMVDVNVRDNAGYTPLHESCVSGNLAIAKALIARGADANAKALDGTRPLHDAVDNNHMEIVRLLLSQGADPTIANYGGRTPLKLARSTNMKAFISDYLADLRDEGPGWELSSYTGRQGDELGFDLLDGAPDSGCCDGGCDLFFDLCSDPSLPMFYLNVDHKVGPRNYHLVKDVSSRLDQDNKDDFMILNSDLRFAEVSKSIVVDQLHANPLFAVDDNQLFEQLEDNVQLVEIDGTLCQLLEVSRESLLDVDDAASCVDFGHETPEATPRGEMALAGEPKQTPAIVARTGRSTPQGCRPKERRRSSNMRKSKSCTSLDMCGLNKTAILRLTALNRSESSPNVQRPSKSRTPPPNPTSVAGCSFLPNATTRERKPNNKYKRSESGSPGGSPARPRTKHCSERTQLQLDKAVLCKEMAITMTALAREVTKTVLSREVNRKVRLSKRIGDGSTSWSTGAAGPGASKLAAIQKGSSVFSADSCGGSAGLKADDRKDPACNGRELSSLSSSTSLLLNSLDDASVDEIVSSADRKIVTASSRVHDADDGGSAPGRDRQTEPEIAGDKPVSDRETRQQGSHRAIGRENATTTSERQPAETTKPPLSSTGAVHEGVPVTSELALPVLENPFEEEAKQVPSVTNEGSGLEEREMPELTLCTY